MYMQLNSKLEVRIPPLHVVLEEIAIQISTTRLSINNISLVHQS